MFLVGRNGEFDKYVASAIRQIKKASLKYNCELILVLPYLTAEFLNNKASFENYYDSVILSHTASKAHPKSAIQIRNKDMVDQADLIICYIENNFGGAYKAIKYAEKQKKKIINLAEDL